MNSCHVRPPTDWVPQKARHTLHGERLLAVASRGYELSLLLTPDRPGYPEGLADLNQDRSLALSSGGGELLPRSTPADWVPQKAWRALCEGRLLAFAGRGCRLSSPKPTGLPGRFSEPEPGSLARVFE